MWFVLFCIFAMAYPNNALTWIGLFVCCYCFIKTHMLGAIVGKGAFSQVLDVKGHPSLVLKVPSMGAIESEVEALERLNGVEGVVVFKYTHTQEDGTECLVMEKVFGKTLQQMWPDFRLTVSDARSMIATLKRVHDAGVMHGDIKPHNWMMEAATRKIVLIDFGMARFSPMAERCGTPAYMAPEMLRGKTAWLDADIYSLGCTLFYLFTHKRAIELPESPRSDDAEDAHLAERFVWKKPSFVVPDSAVVRVAIEMVEKRLPLEEALARLKD